MRPSGISRTTSDLDLTGISSALLLLDIEEREVPRGVREERGVSALAMLVLGVPGGRNATDAGRKGGGCLEDVGLEVDKFDAISARVRTSVHSGMAASYHDTTSH